MQDRSTYKVLVVEDDDAIREALVEALASEGYVVEATASAEDGLGRLLEDAIDLVVTDYGLPKRTGAWLLNEARERGALQGVTALLITAHPSPELVPGVKVVRKPLDLEAFLREIDRLLRPAVDAPFVH